MSDLTLDVVSAHADYTPNQIDYDHAKELFGAIIGDYCFTIKQGTDDSAYLNWNDGVANEWTEHFEKLSHAFARLAHLQACAETNWEKGFASHPRYFANEFDKFINSERI
jgi:hypothetical protein